MIVFGSQSTLVENGAGTMAIQSGQNVALRKPLKNESSRKVANLAHAVLTIYG
jgi:hypothetical protein